MRKKNNIIKLDYSKTKEFFDNRFAKYNEKNPYAVTMYQDNHPELVAYRNKAETKKLIPLLKTDEHSRILDVGCGIGRFADAIGNGIEYYLGVDFEEGFIKVANERNKDELHHFEAITVNDVASRCANGMLRKFNRILMIGILLYFNDDDIPSLLSDVYECLDDNSVICVREPIAIEDRLTLSQEFSEELNDEYNAIYRTKEELLNDKETLKSFVAVGKKYGISDNAIRKWFKSYGILPGS